MNRVDFLYAIFQILGFWEVYGCIPFLYGFVSSGNIVTKHMFSCDYHMSMKSNDKLIMIEVQILLIQSTLILDLW